MHDMNTSNRDNYDNRDYDNRDSYRDYRDSYRDDYRGDYRENYRNDYRDNYRGDYRDSYRKRDYDRRGGKINYRNYREEDYYETLEMCMEDARESYRKYEDLADMAKNSQDRSQLMKMAKREKEHYDAIKEMVEK